MIKISFTEFLVGKRESMAWVAETSWATGGTMTAGEYVGYDCKIDPNWGQGFQEYLAAGTDDLYVQGMLKGPLNLPYSMTFIPVNWRWLKYLMTVNNTSDADAKIHTFTQNVAIASWKLEWAKRHTTPHVLAVIGNACKSATISFTKATGEGTEGHLKVAMDCVGQDVSEGSTVSTIAAGIIAKVPFQYRNIKLTIDGTEYKEVNNGEMAISIGWEEADSRYCNTTYDNLLGEPIPKVFRISGRFNINIQDTTDYDLWEAGTAVSGTCTLLIDKDSTGDDQILFTFANFFVKAGVASTNLDGVTNVDLVWTALSFTSVVARDDITTY